MGALTALGGEQAVEAIHRESGVREAREALGNEIGENAVRLQLSLQKNQCLLPQLDA